MSVTLKTLILGVWKEGVEGVDWIVLHFQGKSDLKKNIRSKMEQWNYGDPTFIVLQDLDGADCIKLKQELSEIAETGSKPYYIRIVCQELESWFIAELAAVEEAYPRSQATKQINKQKYRNPDILTNASEELEKLTGISGKVIRARSIAEHFVPERCSSHSFRVFWDKFLSLTQK